MTTRLAPAFLFCQCGHTGRRHVDGDGSCEASGCTCGGFVEGSDPVARTDDKATGGVLPDRIRVGVLGGPPELVSVITAPHRIEPTAVPRRESIFSRAAASGDPKLRAAGAKLEQALADLAAALEADDRKAATRKRLADIEEERHRLLAELGQQSRIRVPAASRATTPASCVCGREFGSAQAVGVHASRKREQGDDTHGRRVAPESGVE